MPDPKLRSLYDAALATDDFDAHMDLVDLLLANEDQETVALHYELLRDRSNRDLYLALRSAFAKRDKRASEFLAGRVPLETDREMRLDLLHLLGRMRHPDAPALARALVDDPDAEARKRALYVLGWMSEANDIDTLIRTRLLEDNEAEVRRTAATSISQITDRIARAKPRAIRLLYEALQLELDREVTKWIVVTAQHVTGKRFGLKEDVEEGEVSGDLDAAREKCLAALGKQAR